MPAPRRGTNPEEGIVSGADLLVIVPWLIFAIGVITLILLAFTRGGRDHKPRRQRSRQRNR